MSSVHLRCVCNYEFHVLQQFAGQHVRCPSCQQMIVVPLTNIPSIPQPMGQSTQPTAQLGIPNQSDFGHPYHDRPRNTAAYVILACVAAVILVTIVVGGFIWSQRRHQAVAVPKVNFIKDGKLQAPFELQRPTDLSPHHNGKNISKANPSQLAAEALHEAQSGSPSQAIKLQYWAVAQGYDGRYNLACFYSLHGEPTPAIYWLQQAAIHEGIDAEWAKIDPDLANVRRDLRWGTVLAFINEANDFWAKKDPYVHTIILPKNYQGKRPRRVVVCLHGMGHNAEGFLGRRFQLIADQWNIAFIGVCGTLARGKKSFVWSDDHALNHQRIQAAIEQFGKKANISRNDVVLLGFSQGAQAAAEVAARHPETYAGAIVLSPGGLKFSLDSAGGKDITRQGYVLIVGQLEARGNVLLTARYANWLRRNQARVNHSALRGVSTHSLPPRFGRRLPGWITYTLQARQQKGG